MPAEAGAPVHLNVPDPEGDEPSRPLRASRRRLLVAGVAVGCVLVDLLSKAWAVSALGDRSVDVLGDLLRFELTRNPGAAFGTFQGGGVVLGLVAIAAVVWVLYYAGRVDSVTMLVGLGLIAGGASGNLVDRLFRAPGLLSGHVVDFIKFPHWPNFNVADMLVFGGVALFLLAMMRQPKAADDRT